MITKSKALKALAILPCALLLAASIPASADNTPPSVFCELARYQVFPPDEKLTDVGLDLSISDDQDPSPQLEVEVFSNEDDLFEGSWSFSPDAKFEDSILRLRAERSGQGHGRIYLLIVRATDASGNASHDCCVAVVPHDRSNDSIVTLDAQADAAQSLCDGTDGGAVPPDWFDVTDGPIEGPKQ